MACPYCYARRMYKRYHWDETIRFEPEVFNELWKLDIGKRIFVGSTMELFGPWVKDEWIEQIFTAVRETPEHTFIFLTKKPGHLPKWSPFPDNAWIGVSTTGYDGRSGLEDIFAPIRAKVKFVSIEPLLDYTPMDFRWVDWVIVGRQTPISAKTMPRVAWIQDIVRLAEKDGASVFLKDNLRSLLTETCRCGCGEYHWFDWAMGQDGKLRQESPSPSTSGS